MTCDRRTFLTCAALLALAGCSSPPLPQPTPATSDGPLAGAADVPVGGGIVVGEVLLLQLQAGVFTAYEAVCPHAQTVLSPPGADGVITCPTHLSHFKASDGSLVDGPAPRGLRPVQVRVDGGYVRRATAR